MIVEVTMPILGLTMEQGIIVAWLKEVGDRVEVNEPLFMVETDKATSDAPAPAHGYLARVLHEEGDTVAVGAVVALLADTEAEIENAVLWAHSEAPGSGVAPAAPTATSAADELRAEAAGAVADGPAEAGAPAPESRRLFASPRARARAKELGVDLASAAAADRRLTERDVLAMAGPPLKKPSRARKITAERMTLSATTIPQVTYTLRCDITEAMALRRRLKTGAAGEQGGVPLDALIVRAAALSLAAFPDVNAEWVERQGIRLHPQVNIAVAVDLDDRGLVIPVIHGADRLDLPGTATELNRLIAGARAGRLGPDDYAGATFTITSLASLGVETFNPIVVPPQAAILGVGAIVPTPVFRRDEVVKRRLLALSLTTDHRLLDGAPSARFLGRIRDLLEQPARLAD